jgi:hypothetical protein
MSGGLGEAKYVDEMTQGKGDRAKAGVLVSLRPEIAFEVFTWEN